LICTPASTAASADSTRPRTTSADSPCWGGSRIAMSRDEPKFCTCGSVKPACSRPVRTRSIGASPGNAASTVTPPVKSTLKFRPRVNNDTSDASISTAEIT
jgi:hypothetical protein